VRRLGDEDLDADADGAAIVAQIDELIRIESFMIWGNFSGSAKSVAKHARKMKKRFTPAVAGRPGGGGRRIRAAPESPKTRRRIPQRRVGRHAGVTRLGQCGFGSSILAGRDGYHHAAPTDRFPLRPDRTITGSRTSARSLKHSRRLLAPPRYATLSSRDCLS